jgi:hypothetical protein
MNRSAILLKVGLVNFIFFQLRNGYTILSQYRWELRVSEKKFIRQERSFMHVLSCVLGLRRLLDKYGEFNGRVPRPFFGNAQKPQILGTDNASLHLLILLTVIK